MKNTITYILILTLAACSKTVEPPILEQPVYYWDPVIAPGGMIFYDSHVIPAWENNLFISGLKEQHIIRLLIEDNKVIGEERLLESEAQRFRTDLNLFINH